MLCQHCKQNQAVYHFQVDFGPQVVQFHLCGECAQQLSKQYQSMFSGSPAGNWDTAAGPWAQPPKMGGVPTGVDEVFQGRRQLSLLQTRLQDAVNAEDYETAATLRDEIYGVQNAMADRQERQLEKKENLL